MGDEEKRPERIREEVDPQSDDPGIAGVGEVAREGQLIGKADRVAEQIAGHSTADSAPRTHEGQDVEPLRTPAMGESGRGDTITLDADTQRQVRAGDELVVNLPGDGEGWSYDVEGDERSLDISERAGLVLHGQGQRQQPAAGQSFQFVIHAVRRGKATVRFEPQGGTGERIRLRVEVR